MKLYELANEYKEVLEGEGDNLPALLDGIKAPLEAKAVNVAKYINGLSATTVAIEEEIKRLMAMKSAIVNREKSLRDYLEINMRKCGITKIESPLFKIHFKKNPPKVEVADEKLIPDEYKRVKTEVSLDKTKMQFEMKEGVIIPGATLVQTEKLIIK